MPSHGSLLGSFEHEDTSAVGATDDFVFGHKLVYRLGWQTHETSSATESVHMFFLFAGYGKRLAVICFGDTIEKFQHGGRYSLGGFIPLDLNLGNLSLVFSGMGFALPAYFVKLVFLFFYLLLYLLTCGFIGFDVLHQIKDLCFDFRVVGL
jgi:hypothetical protein